MKILVPLKRVADPANHNKVKIPASADKVDTAGLEWQINPFDLYALETALRLTEDGKAPKVRVGEVVALTLGPTETETNLRSALATGADRAIRVDTTDEALDGRLVALAIKKIVEEEKPDLVIMGKQVVDGENNYVGQAVAAMLDWPMATFAATIKEEAGGLLVGREVDGGVSTLRVKFPAVITVDLRIVAPDSVYSSKTAAGFKYPYEEVRFAPLPAIMQAKKKPLAVKKLAELVGDAALTSKYVRFEAPPGRKAGVKVKDVAELVQKLATEAKAI
ncbi:MAG: electron transfer flavoprotein subunit beta/FixA family protein [Polyangiaceae bacterium]|nr:electron transfer flavoprotein subunit beta/FixA family protein [Polyangiaceae bacterium]MCE7893831.1 electron transfer flavoprotein subunit beta/FixA family protein [Sorangiineae bacterium PRO1]MCL4754167.1 electron transfer flavoprotein subunit beta/FixA family protein [Myxococcales bacterium]